jgi:hypothetical protein
MGPVGNRWVRKWVTEQPLLWKSNFRPVNRLRRAFELDDQGVRQWFQHYQQIIEDNTILLADI